MQGVHACAHFPPSERSLIEVHVHLQYQHVTLVSCACLLPCGARPPVNNRKDRPRTSAAYRGVDTALWDDGDTLPAPGAALAGRMKAPPVAAAFELPTYRDEPKDARTRRLRAMQVRRAWGQRVGGGGLLLAGSNGISRVGVRSAFASVLHSYAARRHCVRQGLSRACALAVA